MARTHVTGQQVEVTITSESELEEVRRVARATRGGPSTVKVIVLYSPPSSRVLDRWRRVTPVELRWRIHGATAAEGLAARARQAANGEGVRAVIEILRRAS